MARYFTKQQIAEIKARLATESFRDTDFDDSTKLHGDEYLAIVQDGLNRKVKLGDFMEELTTRLIVIDKDQNVLYNETGTSTVAGMTQAAITGALAKKLDTDKYVLYSKTGTSATAGMTQAGITNAINDATSESPLLLKFSRLTDSEIEQLLALNQG